MCDDTELERAGFADRELVNAIEAILAYAAGWKAPPFSYQQLITVFFRGIVLRAERNKFELALTAASVRSMRARSIMLGALVVLGDGPRKGLPPKNILKLAAEFGVRHEGESDADLAQRLIKEAHNAYGQKGDWVNRDCENGGIMVVHLQ